MSYPRYCARLRPSAVRESTSASPPNTASISRPVLMPVSAHGSAKDRMRLGIDVALDVPKRSKMLQAKRPMRVSLRWPRPAGPR